MNVKKSAESGIPKYEVFKFYLNSIKLHYPTNYAQHLEKHGTAFPERQISVVLTEKSGASRSTDGAIQSIM